MGDRTGKGMAAFMTATVLLSGLFGYGGTYLANRLHDQVMVAPSKHEDDNALTASENNIDSPFTLQLSTKAVHDKALTIPEIAAMNGDSVVEITTETVTTGGRMGQFVSEGAGSGVIIRSNGYIVTNNHVISGANKITVRLKSGETYDASLVGRDVKTDLAVIKINETDLPTAIMGSSSQLVVGELAVAIGNPLGQLGGTVTEGIISALDRDIVIDGESMKLLQTSAAINPGNSGGGLFNQYGELIGIVNAKSSGSGIEGLGFAIPIDTAKVVIDQIISYGYVQGRVDLGLTLIDINDSRTALMYRVSKTGVYVLKAEKNNGFKSGDRIISVNDTAITSSRDVKDIIDSLGVGKTVKFTIERNRQTLVLNVTLEQATH